MKIFNHFIKLFILIVLLFTQLHVVAKEAPENQVNGCTVCSEKMLQVDTVNDIPILTEMSEQNIDQISPTFTHKTMPYWKVLFLVYKNIDTDYTDGNGQTQHLTHTLSATEIENGVSAFRQYPALAHTLSDSESFVQYDIVYVDRPLTSVTSLGTNLWWPSPTDTREELDIYVSNNYDSVLVLWPQTNFETGQQIPSHWGLGLMPTSWANNATYGTVANAPTWMWQHPMIGEPWLHEWLHGVSYFYAERGFRMPEGDADGGGSHGYIWSPTTGWTDYYRDLMTGNVLENGELLGISAQAWQTGSIIGSHETIYADYFKFNSLSNYYQQGFMNWHQTNEYIQMNSNASSGNKILAPTLFTNDVMLTGRVYIPEADSIGFFDSISLAISNGSIEYWGTLAYGTHLTQRNNIAIMRNDQWQVLYPMPLEMGWYTIKMSFDSNQHTLQLKVWPDGTNEPSWQLTHFIEPSWRVNHVGYRHFGTAITFVDDIYAIGSSNFKIALPLVMR